MSSSTFKSGGSLAMSKKKKIAILDRALDQETDGRFTKLMGKVNLRVDLTKPEARFRVRAVTHDGELLWLVFKPLNQEATDLIHGKVLAIRPFTTEWSYNVMYRTAGMIFND